MEPRDLLPRTFADAGQPAGASATRTALREFFPVVLILVAVDLSTDGTLLGRYTVIPSLNHPVPADIYLFAFLGAGAYAVTSLAFNPKQSIVETYRLTYRLVGALPLGAGVFILADVFVDASSVAVPLAGLAFLSGLYVRLALRRLADAAEKLYGGEPTPGLYEIERRRRQTAANLRRCWRQLATADRPADRRERVVGWLERAGAIVDDGDATRQELARALELSDRARQQLDVDPAAVDAPGSGDDTGLEGEPADDVAPS